MVKYVKSAFYGELRNEIIKFDSKFTKLAKEAVEIMIKALRLGIVYDENNDAEICRGIKYPNNEAYFDYSGYGYLNNSGEPEHSKEYSLTIHIATGDDDFLSIRYFADGEVFCYLYNQSFWYDSLFEALDTFELSKYHPNIVDELADIYAACKRMIDTRKRDLR